MRQAVKEKVAEFIKWVNEIKVQLPRDEQEEMISAIKKGLK